jgi:hypothetical protein
MEQQELDALVVTFQLVVEGVLVELLEQMLVPTMELLPESTAVEQAVVVLFLGQAVLVLVARFVLFGPDVHVHFHQLARGRHELVY